MSDPIVLISRNRIKAGRLDEFWAHYRESIPRTQADKPGTVVQLAYVSNDETEVVIVRVFPSGEDLDRQLQGADVRSKAAYQFIEPTRIELYGAPNPYALEMMAKVAGSGVEVQISPQYLGGFIRPLAG